jgi:hypothetical protein
MYVLIVNRLIYDLEEYDMSMGMNGDGWWRTNVGGWKGFDGRNWTDKHWQTKNEIMTDGDGDEQWTTDCDEWWVLWTTDNGRWRQQTVTMMATML